MNSFPKGINSAKVLVTKMTLKCPKQYLRQRQQIQMICFNVGSSAAQGKDPGKMFPQ